MSTKRERRERTRPLAKAAFPILDEYEEEDWELRKSGKDSHDDQAAVRDADFFRDSCWSVGTTQQFFPM